MTISVEKINNNAFSQVTSRDLSEVSWAGPSRVELPKVENDAVTLNSLIVTPKQARKTNNVKIIGISIAGATVLTAAGLVLLLKGGPRSLGKNFVKFRNLIEKNIQIAKLEGEDVASKSEKIGLYVINKIDNFVKKSDAINNYTTIKDLLFKRMMGVNKYLAKFHDGMTRVFEKFGRQAVINKYFKVTNKLDSATRYSTGLVLSPMRRSISGDKVDETVKLTREIVDMTDEFFGRRALTRRYFSYKQSAERLKNSLSHLKSFVSKDLFTKFIADSKITSDRESVAKEMLLNRHKISYTKPEMFKDSDEFLAKIINLVNIKDGESLRILRNIRHGIKKSVNTKSVFVDLEAKQKVLADIDDFVSRINSMVKEGQISADRASQIQKFASGLRAGYSNYEPGKLELLLSKYKEILSPGEYEKVEKNYMKWIKSLDDAIKVESEDFINKLRDLSMGSAPTDLLTVAGSLGILGYQLGKSKDNDQRTSIALKYGIPALAGIAGTLYFNAKLFAGLKSLFFGSVLSFSMNRLGAWADEALKRRKNKNNQVQNPSLAV